MKHCECCGQQIQEASGIVGVDRIVALLKARPGRDVYECADGSYAITRQGGAVEEKFVKEALKLNLIKPLYPDNPRVRCYVLA